MITLKKGRIKTNYNFLTRTQSHSVLSGEKRRITGTTESDIIFCLGSCVKASKIGPVFVVISLSIFWAWQRFVAITLVVGKCHQTLLSLLQYERTSGSTFVWSHEKNIKITSLCHGLRFLILEKLLNPPLITSYSCCAWLYFTITVGTVRYLPIPKGDCCSCTFGTSYPDFANKSYIFHIHWNICLEGSWLRDGQYLADKSISFNIKLCQLGRFWLLSTANTILNYLHIIHIIVMVATIS